MIVKNPMSFFRKFAFILSVGDQTHGLAMAKETTDGLILGRPHAIGRPSIMTVFQELGLDAEIEIVLMGGRDPDDPNRRIVYSLGFDRADPVHLAIDLDNAADGVAFDRVLFPGSKLIRVVDE